MKVIGYIFLILLLIGFGVLAVKIGWWDAFVNWIGSLIGGGAV